MCAPRIYTKNYFKPAYSIRMFFILWVPNLVFCFKCNNLAFFGWRHGNVDNYSLF